MADKPAVTNRKVTVVNLRCLCGADFTTDCPWLDEGMMEKLGRIPAGCEECNRAWFLAVACGLNVDLPESVVIGWVTRD